MVVGGFNVDISFFIFNTSKIIKLLKEGKFKLEKKNESLKCLVFSQPQQILGLSRPPDEEPLQWPLQTTP